MPRLWYETRMPDVHTGPPYPGLGLPLCSKRDGYQQPSDTLPVRELAMMHIMDRLTDKKDWNKKVFDEGIVAKWREEAKAIPDIEFWKMSIWDKSNYSPYLSNEEGDEGEGDEDENKDMVLRFRCLLEDIVNDNTFDCIIQELQSKAAYFEKTGLIPTLDASYSVVKSDTLVSVDLQNELRSAFQKLLADHSESPDWHPESNDMVLDLVHPSMYPLVYGKSRVYKEELVGVNNAINLSRTGQMIEKDVHGVWGYGERGRVYSGPGIEMKKKGWNDTYQWLPANLEFQDDGKVKFSSYINNLHPIRYPDIYRVIEKLVEKVVPAWDQCLDIHEDGYGSTINAGREVSRFGPIDDEQWSDNWIPPDEEDLANVTVNWDDYSETFLRYHIDDEDEEERKWKLLRKACIPEATFEDVNYAPPKSGGLFNKFRKTGLQVIIKMVSIELTPEKPDFPAGNWHVEGQKNERIRATALYYLDSDNITTSNLSFRIETDEETQHEWICADQGTYSWQEQVWGTELSDDCLCVQNYGNVETHQGRLLAFPNCFQRRFSSFSLADRTRPGHRRFIALWLVDPEQRIISTANVPPQQQDWWFDAIINGPNETPNEGKKQESGIALLTRELSLKEASDEGQKEKAAGGKLPPELMDIVWEEFQDAKDKGLMSVEEAKEHRLKLIGIKTGYVHVGHDELRSHTYNFSKH